jgi:hypothetical protein
MLREAVSPAPVTGPPPHARVAQAAATSNRCRRQGRLRHRALGVAESSPASARQHANETVAASSVDSTRAVAHQGGRARHLCRGARGSCSLRAFRSRRSLASTSATTLQNAGARANASGLARSVRRDMATPRRARSLAATNAGPMPGGLASPFSSEPPEIVRQNERGPSPRLPRYGFSPAGSNAWPEACSRVGTAREQSRREHPS